MNNWVYIIVFLYLGVLVYCTFSARAKNQHDGESNNNIDNYLYGDRTLRAPLALLTFSATLFSTFTLMGMPDFFRTHGVGAWIFLGVTNAALALVVLFFGYMLRSKFSTVPFRGMANALNSSFGNNFSGYTYLLGVSIFLIPYISVQIKGLSIFLSALFPEFGSPVTWSLVVFVCIFMYSLIGGLRAIIYSDAVQAIVLFIVAWITGILCYFSLGGDFDIIFNSVELIDARLLSTPGPKGLFTAQFLLVSFIVILLMPITQPQLTLRLSLLKDNSQLRIMSLSLAIFSIVLMFPIIIIGTYGSVNMYGEPATLFWQEVLYGIHAPVIGAISVIGLLAAGMSTADSQLFALGTEYNAGLKVVSNSKFKIKLILLFFTLASMVLANMASDELVLLARVSFSGTALLAPMIIVGLFFNRKTSVIVVPATIFSIVVYCVSLLGFLPGLILGWRIDAWLLLLVFTSALVDSYRYLKVYREVVPVI